MVADDAATEGPLRLQIGTLALALERKDDAVGAYERVLALKPGDEEAYNALDAIYTNLASGVTAQTITVTGNWGVATDTPSIATAKGWTVTG